MRGGGGVECPLETSDWEIFADVSGKKRERKKEKRSENWEEKNENCKRVFFFFCFSLLKTTEICFGSTKMGIFYREKAFHAVEKNQEKWLCPHRKICLLCTCSEKKYIYSIAITPLHVWWQSIVKSRFPLVTSLSITDIEPIYVIYMWVGVRIDIFMNDFVLSGVQIVKGQILNCQYQHKVDFTLPTTSCIL